METITENIKKTIEKLKAVETDYVQKMCKNCKTAINYVNINTPFTKTITPWTKNCDEMTIKISCAIAELKENFNNISMQQMNESAIKAGFNNDIDLGLSKLDIDLYKNYTD